MQFTLSALFLAALLGQPPQAPIADLPEPTDKMPVVMPAQIDGSVGRMVKIEAKSIGPITIAYYPGIRDSADVVAFDKTIIFVAAREGVYWIGACTVAEGKVSQPVWVMIKIGIPPPLPPLPPGPQPKPPIPPKPEPTPTKPIGPGYKMMIIFDAKNVQSLPPAQQALINSTVIRKHLNTYFPMGPDNQTREWRIWPSTANATFEAAHWKDGFSRPRTSNNWIILSNGTTGQCYEGPLPANVEELYALIAKYEK